jgi:hypothetical protein
MKTLEVAIAEYGDCQPADAALLALADYEGTLA